MSESALADSAPLTVDQAVEAMTAVTPEQDNTPAPEAPIEAAEEPVQTEDDPNPSEDTSEAEEPGDGEDAEETTEAEAEPVDPPQWWDAEAKAEFAKLTPEVQAVVFAQEGKREAIVTKAKQEASEALKDVAKVQLFAEGLNQLIPQIQETFKSRWDGVDWAATLDQYGAEETLKLQMQFEGERQQLDQAKQAGAQADVMAHQTFVRTEAAKLEGTPLAAAEARAEVGQYLWDNLDAEDDAGKAEAIRNISAGEMTIAHKAMLWDRAQKGLSKPTAPKPPAPVKAVAKPTATTALVSSQTRSSNQAANRYAQTRSIDDAVALLLSGK